MTPFSYGGHTHVEAHVEARGQPLCHSPPIADHLRLGQDLSLSLQLTDELDLQPSNAQGPASSHLPRAGVTGINRGA